MRLTLSIFLVTVLSFTVQAQLKKNQIGMRIGDPIGVNFKTYISEKAALEFVVATAKSDWNTDYYRDSFQALYFDSDDYKYVDHDVESVLYLGARYLSHKQIVWTDIPGRFDWFWGVGVLAKSATVNYHYIRYFVVDGEREGVHENSEVNDYDIGPEGIAGIQYTFNEVPLTIGFDVSVLIETHDRPGVIRGFSGLAFRYNF